MNDIKWINSLEDEYITYAAFVWKVDKAEAWGLLDRAIKNEGLSSYLPFTEFQEYIRLFIQPTTIQPTPRLSKREIEIDEEWITSLKNRSKKLKQTPLKEETAKQSKEVTGGLEELRYNLYKEQYDLLINEEKKETKFSLRSPEQTKTFSPLIIWGGAISIVLYFILIASSIPDVINGLLITTIASFLLYSTYVTRKIWLTFRASIIVWFMFFIGIAIIFGLHK